MTFLCMIYVCVVLVYEDPDAPLGRRPGEFIFRRERTPVNIIFIKRIDARKRAGGALASRNLYIFALQRRAPIAINDQTLSLGCGLLFAALHFLGFAKINT